MAETPYEQAVLAALNTARADPGAYARGLQTFRTYYKGNVLRAPGDAMAYQTQEGVKAVDEAVTLVSATSRSGSLAPSDVLRMGALDHVHEQAGGATGHYSDDGASPADRVRAHGGGGMVAEVIAYGARDPIDVIRQLVIDDGVPSRGHRNLLFDPAMRFAGVACGPHATFRMVCVIDMSQTVDGDIDAPRRVASAPSSDFVKQTGDLLKGLTDAAKAAPPER